MTARIHPLSGQPINGKKRVNGEAREQLVQAMAMLNNSGRQRGNLSYDAARSGTDLDSHWRLADGLDADNANNQTVRHTLMKRSRYEQGSNGIYDGILTTHCNMLVGVGPTLRMLTKSRAFNQLVEREFFAWMQQTKLRRNLWAMCHARFGDGESFGILQTNPMFPSVQLDMLPIEAEQCQTPYGMVEETGRVDGIYFDDFNNIVAYEILKAHPGSNSYASTLKTEVVSAKNAVHWFKLKRPGMHRSPPECTSSLNVGASSRRHREATVAAAETAADISALIHSNLTGSADPEPDPQAPYTSIGSQKRMVMTLPMGWTATQMKGEHPNAEYSTFHRLQVAETARPLGQPYNLAACDSSTYSFASGKLDTLGYRIAIDVERQDCNDLVLDVIFVAWFREWKLAFDGTLDPELITAPLHQWDWPSHPIIDALAEANATNRKLQDGTITLRQVYSDAGQDYEDQLFVMAEDWFGEATDETIAKARQINMLRTIPQHAIAYVANIMGLAPAVQPNQQPTGAPGNEPTPVQA